MIKIISINQFLCIFILVTLGLLTVTYFVAFNIIKSAVALTSVSKFKTILSTPDVSTSGTSSGNGKMDLTSVYEFPDLGLKIKYPESWEIVEYGKAVRAYGDGVIVSLLSPLEDKSDKFREFVQLKIENLSSDNLGKRPANSTIGANPIYEMAFDRPNLANRSDILRTLSEWSPLNGKAFVVEFSAEKSEFAKYLTIAQKIINSIEINGAGINSSSESESQSSQSQSSGFQDESNITTVNKTQTSSLVEKLLHRGINRSETDIKASRG